MIQETDKSLILLEASTGIEPVYTDLQSAASPLRQLAIPWCRALCHGPRPVVAHECRFLGRVCKRICHLISLRLPSH